MRVDNFVCKFGLVIVTAKLGTHYPQYKSDEKQRRRGSQPLPKERLGRSTVWRNRVEICVNCSPQRGGGRLIDLSKLQSTAHDRVGIAVKPLLLAKVRGGRIYPD